MTSKKTIFSEAIQKTIQLLDDENINYFLLGGVATAFVGEPRMTRDLDIDIFLTKTKTLAFLKKAKENTFKVNDKEMKERIKAFGNFRMFYKEIPIDMILASTELEASALKRRKTVACTAKKHLSRRRKILFYLSLFPEGHKTSLTLNRLC